MRVVLASSSPRRRAILSMLKLNFEVIPSNIDERVFGDPIATARRLAFLKALEVWRKNRDALVIGSDTLVFLENRIIGKPRSQEEAFRTLRCLSGRWHKVVTAVALISPRKRKMIHDVAKVKFRRLSDEEIKEYIASGEPMDKAGAYGVQGLGSVFIEKIRGNFYTVMGLPVVKVYLTLRKDFGIIP